MVAPNDGSLQGPTAPLLVWESGDLSVFDSVEHAENWFEAIDVADGIFKAFDATGRLLQLKVRSEKERCLFFSIRRERVAVSLAEVTPTHREELTKRLTDVLAARGALSGFSERRGFEELVALASRAPKAK